MSWSCQNNKGFHLSLQVFWCHWHPLLVTLKDILECFHQKWIPEPVLPLYVRASSSVMTYPFPTLVSLMPYIFLTYITYSGITGIINLIKISLFSIFISVPPLCVSSRSWNTQISWKWLPADFYLYIAWWIQTSSWNKLLYYVWLFSVHLCFSELMDESFCQNISYLHKMQEFEFKILCMAQRSSQMNLEWDEIREGGLGNYYYFYSIISRTQERKKMIRILEFEW